MSPTQTSAIRWTELTGGEHDPVLGEFVSAVAVGADMPSPKLS